MSSSNNSFQFPIHSSSYGSTSQNSQYQYNQSQNIQQNTPQKPLDPLNFKSRKPIHTAFFSNIPFNYPIDQFTDLVKQFGDIANMYCLIPKKGFAFVTYYNLRDSQQAVEKLSGHILLGRPIRTNYANKSVFTHRDPRSTCACLQLKFSPQTKLQKIDVMNFMKQFGEIHEFQSDRPGLFVVKYYDIRDAQRAICNGYITIKDETGTAEFLLDDEDIDISNAPQQYNNMPKQMIPPMSQPQMMGQNHNVMQQPQYVPNQQMNYNQQYQYSYSPGQISQQQPPMQQPPQPSYGQSPQIPQYGNIPPNQYSPQINNNPQNQYNSPQQNAVNDETTQTLQRLKEFLQKKY